MKQEQVNALEPAFAYKFDRANGVKLMDYDERQRQFSKSILSM